MEIIKEVMDTTISKVALGVGGIGVTYLEFIPFWLRAFTSIAIIAKICASTYKTLKEAKAIK
jgi:hypothetical protein